MRLPCQLGNDQAAGPRFTAPHSASRGQAAASRRVRASPLVTRSAGSPQAQDRDSMQWLWDRSAGNTKARVQQKDLRAKKSLGQNFLITDAVLEAIVRSAGVRPGDTVLEIGPGTGNLTKHLLLAGASITAVEKDYSLAAALEQEFGSRLGEQLEVVVGDALAVNLPALLKEIVARRGDPEARVKVIANLPFYITTDVLKLLLPLGDTVSHLYFLMQDEVAERLVRAGPKAPVDYRAINVQARFYSDLRYLFRIDRAHFFPQPKCNGAMVEFALRPQSSWPAVPNHRAFARFATAAFSQRRKMLHNSLKAQHGSGAVVEALRGLGLREDVRAQDLSQEQFVALHCALACAAEGEVNGDVKP